MPGSLTTPGRPGREGYLAGLAAVFAAVVRVEDFAAVVFAGALLAGAFAAGPSAAPAVARADVFTAEGTAIPSEYCPRPLISGSTAV